MKQFFSLLVLLLSAGYSIAQVSPQWARYPSISPDGSSIVFTYKGDLYRVPSSGGKAEQLTFHEGHDFMPVWSRDGSHIAFASDRYGNFDVFVMEAEGGEAARLNYHSNNEVPYTFSADGKSVLFDGVRQDLASHRQYPTATQPELYKVPTAGERVDMVWTIPAEYVQINNDGSKMIYHDKKGGENEWRKHHTSAITRDIWVYDASNNTHSMITNWAGEDRQPVFSNDEQTIYFLSEESGNFNIHKMPLANPSARSQVTQFETHPVRF